MSVIKCGACGKFYNDGQYNACPSCGVGPESVEPQESEVTQPIIENTEFNTEATSLGKYAQQNPIASVPGIDPICGWLVCTEGPDQGRDFRIKSERNFVGRSPSMDIVISGDESISRENHASITFDPRTHSFTLNTGNGRGLVYLNQNVVDAPSTLNSYDLIELGETKLLFVPFAGDQFSWNK